MKAWFGASVGAAHSSAASDALDQCRLATIASSGASVRVDTCAAGVGLFATKAIPLGALVLCEDPLVSTQTFESRSTGCIACDECQACAAPLAQLAEGLCVDGCANSIFPDTGSAAEAEKTKNFQVADFFLQKLSR